MKSPIGSFSGSVRSSGNLDETVVETEIVTERILPSLSVLPVVGKVFHDEFVDLRKRQHSLRTMH